MSDPKRIFDDTILDGVNLSAEARNITQDAAAAMRTWINQSIDTLESRLTKDSAAALAELDQAREEIKTTFEGLDTEIKKLEKLLQDSSAKLGPALPAVKEMTEAVAAMKTELAARKAKAEKAGLAAVGVLKTGFRSIGLPIP